MKDLIQNCKSSVLWVLVSLIFGALPVKGQELQEYLKMAAANNQGLQAQRMEYEAALQDVLQARGIPDPNLSISAFGKMEDARITLMQPIPWLGNLDAREKQADLQARAIYQNYRTELNQLLLEVSQRYFRLYALEEQIRYEVHNQDIIRELKEAALARMRSGGEGLAQVMQVDQLMNQSQSNLRILELEKESQLHRFNAVTSRDSNARVNLPDSLEIDALPIVSLDHLDQNSRLIELDHRMAAATQSKEVVRKSSLPQLGVGLDLMVNQRMMMEEKGDHVLMPMLSVSLPLFRKKYRAAEEKARLQFEGYRLEREQLRKELHADLEEAINKAEIALEQLSLYQKQSNSSEQILELLLTSYRNPDSGGSDLRGILEVREQLLEYQVLSAQARGEYLSQLAQITFLTGKFLSDENEK